MRLVLVFLGTAAMLALSSCATNEEASGDSEDRTTEGVGIGIGSPYAREGDPLSSHQRTLGGF